MNNFTYENQANSTYLVYEIDETDIIDNLSLGMINNNKIMGLAPVIYSQIDDKKYLKYNVSAKVSASTFLAGAASRNRILGVFSGVAKALLSAEEYMLDANTIILDLNYIYVDVTTCEAELICLPVQRGNFNDVVSFFKNIIFSVTYDQTENCDYVAKMIGCLNNHSSFSLQNFKETIDELNGRRINLQNLQNSQQAAAQEAVKVVYTEILHETAESAALTNLQQETRKKAPVPGQNPAMQAETAGKNVQNFQTNQQVLQRQVNQVGRYPAPGPGTTLSDMQTSPQNNQMNNYSGQGRKYTEQQLQKKQKADKRNRKGQSASPADYTVPGAPRVRPNIPSGHMPIQQGVPVQPQKKGGFLEGLFRKKEKKGNESAPQFNGSYMQPQYDKRIVREQNIPSQNDMGNTGFRNMKPQTGPGNPNFVQSQYVQPEQKPALQENIRNVKQEIAPKPVPQGRIMNFGETTVLGNDMINGETSVLSAPGAAQPYLVRKKNGEKVYITGSIFRIGKEANYVDYFIGDNSAVSRSHANIVVSGNDYYIVDTNSKNHTYVNGQMIQSNMETLLAHGSTVKLANEEFEFYMY